MRTFTLVSAVLLSSSAIAGSLANFEPSFDTSILNARAALPATVPMSNAGLAYNASSKRGMVKMVKRQPLQDKEVQKRGDDGECEPDEDDDSNSSSGNTSSDTDDSDDAEECDDEEDGDDQEDCDDSEDQPETQQPAQQQPQPQTPAKSEEKPAAPAKQEDKPASKPHSNIAVPEKVSTSPATPQQGAKATETPSNLAPESFKVSDGCIRYHTVLDGEVCLGVLDGSRDLGLTLDQLYCLNPGLSEDCSNLYAGMAYCTGYGGEWPADS